MQDQNCLERAMFAASESYSRMVYALEDCGSSESSDNKESPAHRVRDVFPADSFV